MQAKIKKQECVQDLGKFKLAKNGGASMLSREGERGAKKRGAFLHYILRCLHMPLPHSERSTGLEFGSHPILGGHNRVPWSGHDGLIRDCE